MKHLSITLRTDEGDFSAEIPIPSKVAKDRIILVDHGEKKIQVIKEIRAFTGIGLKEAKETSELLPRVFVQKDMVGAGTHFDINAFSRALESLGAEVKQGGCEGNLAAEIIEAFVRASRI